MHINTGFDGTELDDGLAHFFCSPTTKKLDLQEISGGDGVVVVHSRTPLRLK